MLNRDGIILPVLPTFRFRVNTLKIRSFYVTLSYVYHHCFLLQYVKQISVPDEKVFATSLRFQVCVDGKAVEKWQVPAHKGAGSLNLRTEFQIQISLRGNRA